MIEGFLSQGICHVADGTAPVLAEACGRAALATGLSDGPVTCEILLHQNVAYVIELSLRMDSARFLAAAVKQALGEVVTQEDLQG
jgi:hypothetical protein